MRLPNILILYTDQQRWDTLGVFGNEQIHTPNLDRLAQQSAAFDHCFVQGAVCMPSRASFLSGCYPSTLRLTHMGVPVPADTVTAATILGRHGYRCANIGKLHFLPHSRRDHRELHPGYGFDHLQISDEPGCYEDAYRAWVRRRAPQQLDRISLGLPPAASAFREHVMAHDDGVVHPSGRSSFQSGAFAAPADLTHTAFVADQTMALLASGQHEPWFCVAGFYSPHSPFIAPQPYLDLYDPSKFQLPHYPPQVQARRSEQFSDARLRAARHGYYAMISELDDWVGRILDGLDRQGIADQTIVVFTSDHGEWLGEHLRWGKGFPGNDPVGRVPLLIRAPGAVRQPGRVRHGLVEALDVLPTLLELAGLPLPPHLQGRSLRPMLEDAQAAGRDDVLMEHRDWRNLRTTEWRYVLRDDGDEWLWNLASDPGEHENLAGQTQHQSHLHELRRRLAVRMLQANQPLPRDMPY